ncbi:aspartate aminotransferase family protein [Jiulongibacter sediminis]|uniref:Acetylornithine aminotransferase n=1 Tax=Jiulongibacter sediminis TaxID=1605367 RepID=A0A0P7BUR9_9BACT|nr:aminotransferase class III-fold pyridoxal phosphate-dependent enzyme [Jiulongibacter sediminis]KPM48575.1 acetylornithine aminotransferase [Jiulongibacter sediminis]TBX25113.1 acetylornithine aminotransferase [Jiulongibacter sediminis]
MNTFNVYPIYDINPVKALNSTLWDENGTKYTDLYGGHAVISIGHSHPEYVKAISDQVANLGFYSNSVRIPLQQQLAEKLGELSGLPDYQLFLANSGAEANENALKLASFHNGRKKIIAFKKGFHGRSSAAVAVTDNPNIKAAINDDSHVIFLDYNDAEAVREAVDDETCAVIVEGIQGVGGIHVGSDEFMKAIRESCDQHGAVFIHDSVQCGYGRSGKFFTWEFSGVKPDIISMAKGMGNGFPVGGILISPKFEAKYGLLGTTFGGNHLACAAALSVLQVIEEEGLLDNARVVGEYAFDQLKKISGIKELRGRGLMIGIELDQPVKEIREKILFDDKIFTGVAGAHTIRLLPSLGVCKEEIDAFISALKKYLI